MTGIPSTPTIERVRTRRLVAPLTRPWAADVTANHVIVVDVALSDGSLGHGFTWTPSVGASAVHAMLDDELVPRALGRPADPETLWMELWTLVHEAGGGGITTIALAGLDLALWDARARSRGVALADLLGRRRDAVPLYGSGINLHYSDDELAAQARRWVAAGYSGVKMKIGRLELDDDLRRIALVRSIIGPDRALRVDANQRWDLDAAHTAAAALEPLGIDWLEEPLRADDTAGYRALAASTSIPIAAGENLHTIHRFRDLLDAGALQVAQPNVVRVGGITPFLAIAAEVVARGARLAPHLQPELSAQLALALPAIEAVERVEEGALADTGVLAGPSPMTLDGAESHPAGSEPGLGIRFIDDTTSQEQP